jgi:hypothetical protein
MLKSSSYNTNAVKLNSNNNPIRKKANSVLVEGPKELGLVKEVEEIKEETGRKTVGSQFEGYLTCKKSMI